MSIFSVAGRSGGLPANPGFPEKLISATFMNLSFSRLLAILALIVPACCPQKPIVRSHTERRRVVLVHGFLETGSLFKTLKRRLQDRGVSVFVPSLRPIDGRGGLAQTAANLKQDIDARFGPDAPISLVGFSMGGIVSREYLQHHGGTARCQHLITVSSPHHGTRAAGLYPSQGVKEMRPGSPFLENLERTEDRLGKIPVTSYYTRLDLVILPATSSVWDRAENIEHPALLHPLMLTAKPVLDGIEKRLMMDVAP